MPLSADAVWAPGPCLVRTEPTQRPHGCGRHPARAPQLRCAGLSLSSLPPRNGAWQRIHVGGGCSGGGTEGAARCCLRRLWHQICRMRCHFRHVMQG